MTLPVLNATKYELKLLIADKTIEIRPWLVGEEKQLLIAKESDKPEEVANTIVNILNGCTFDVDVETLSLTDVEWILLNVKAYSSGETTEMRIKCSNPDKDGEECGHTETINVDIQKETGLSETTVLEPKIELSGGIGIAMRNPEFSVFKKLLHHESFTESTFEMLAASIDYIWEGDEVFKNITPEEALKFIESMNKKQLKDITAYLDSLPKLELRYPYTCEKCKHEGEFVLRNFFNFFID